MRTVELAQQVVCARRARAGSVISGEVTACEQVKQESVYLANASGLASNRNRSVVARYRKFIGKYEVCGLNHVCGLKMSV